MQWPEWVASLPKAVFSKNCRGKVLKQCSAGSVVKLHRRNAEEKLSTSSVKTNRKGKKERYEKTQAISSFVSLYKWGISVWRVKRRGKSSGLTEVIPTWEHSEMRMGRVLSFQIHPWSVQISLKLLKNFLEEAEGYLLQPFAFGKEGEQIVTLTMTPSKRSVQFSHRSRCLRHAEQRAPGASSEAVLQMASLSNWQVI